MTAEQEQLVLDHLGLVRWLAKRLDFRHRDRADLVGAGNLGLVIAAMRYIPSRHPAFPKYATAAIRHEMLNWLRHDRVIDLPDDVAKAVAKGVVTARLRRDYADPEAVLADAMRVSRVTVLDLE